MADFDRLTDRRGTDCLKYDFAAERGYPAEVLPFWVADMDFPAPEPVVKALEQRARHGIFGYTDIKEDYREILARWFQRRHGWQIEGEWLSITPGVVFGICTAIRAFTQPGEGVLICPPVYYPFAASIKANGRKLVESPLVEKDGHYEIDFQDFEQKIVANEVKLFVLCSPHNPVGRVWSRQELEQVAAICQKHQVLVVADEIHQDFVRPGHRHTVFASLSEEVAAFTITCTSPSKTFNLAGLQISHIFISNESLRRRFRHELEAVGYGEPNAMAEVAAKAAYSEGEPWLTELLAYLEENLRRTRAFLAEHLPQVKLIEPEGTYLLWLDCRGTGLSPEEQDEAIVQRGRIWLDEGRIFGKGGEGFQRINMACPWAILEEGLKRLAFALKK
ncbi:MAG: pyridoxal phosphate-dependent aminotransferase [Selenomonas ruminantium]|nr:pyridoxal phosphate-dependent aminotransferase [Selenomonas ruminantium]